MATFANRKIEYENARSLWLTKKKMFSLNYESATVYNPFKVGDVCQYKGKKVIVVRVNSGNLLLVKYMEPYYVEYYSGYGGKPRDGVLDHAFVGELELTGMGEDVSY
jgi:hypothetical protein